ncbi:hypothetical protein BJX70DRAFT_357024 [Aspergillus crustosus]
MASIPYLSWTDKEERPIETCKLEDLELSVVNLASMPTGIGAKDLDMACFSLVKTFPECDPRAKAMPPWPPKEPFHRVAKRYQSLSGPSTVVRGEAQN